MVVSGQGSSTAIHNGQVLIKLAQPTPMSNDVPLAKAGHRPKARVNTTGSLSLTERCAKEFVAVFNLSRRL